MLNLRNGGFLLGLLAGIALTALLGIFVFTLVQAARPAQPAVPQPVASVTPTDPLAVAPTTAPIEAPTNTPTDTHVDAPTDTPVGAPTDTPTAAPAEAPTETPTLAPVELPTDTPAVTRTITATVGYPGNYALAFDGGSDRRRATIPHDAALAPTAFTLEAWVYPTGNASEMAILSKGSGLSGGDYLFNLTGDKMSLFTGDFPWYTATSTVPLNTWSHVAVTRDDSGTVTFYLNGVADGSIANTAIPTPTTVDVRIGLQGGDCLCNEFIGTIDEVRVWNTARSQEDIEATRSILLAGNEAGLVANWRLDEGTGQTLADTTGRHSGFLGADAEADSADPRWIVSSAPVENLIVETPPTPVPGGAFPTPVPTPVAVPFSGETIGLGVNLNAVAINGTAQSTLQVEPGEEFNVTADYNVWSTLEPIPGGDNSGRCASTCIVNLTVGIVSSDGGYQPLECIFNGTPRNAPGAQRTWNPNITAPTTPGVYGLRLDYHLTYNCQQAFQDVNPLRPAISLATFEVQ
jgi:hypothetical protein